MVAQSRGASATTPYEVTKHAGGVQIDGLTIQEAREALALLTAARELQSERGASVAAGLLRAVSEAGLELTPPASVEQARRMADLRQALLATPAYSYETLGEVRGDTRASTTRTWVSRMRDRGRLFTVRSDGRTAIPAFQLTERGEPRAELADVLRKLLKAGVDGWPLWIWLTSPTPLLSGEVPAETVASDPERVQKAAARFAARRRTAA